MKLSNQYPFILGLRHWDKRAVTPNDYLGEIARFNSTIYREGSTDGFRRSSDADTDAKKFVRNALSRTLGHRMDTTNPRAMLATIDRAFVSKQDEIGNTIFEWTPRSYAVQTELGGKITGAQASLYRRAKSALDEILPLLDRLEPLKNAPDEEEIDAYRAIVRQEIITLVDELGIEGGWRESRVNLLFDNLLGSVRTKKRFGNGHLSKLAQVLGIRSNAIVTIEEEEVFTDFIVIYDHTHSLRESWLRILQPNESSFLGTKIVQIERALHSLVEGVDELRYVMDSVGLGEAERRVVRLEFLEVYAIRRNLYRLNTLTIEEMLDWIVNFATEEAPYVIENGGTLGVNALLPTLHRLYQIVNQSLKANNTHNALRTSRVIGAIEELASHVLQVSEIIEADDTLIILRDFRENSNRIGQVVLVARTPNFKPSDLNHALHNLFDDPLLIQGLVIDEGLFESIDELRGMTDAEIADFLDVNDGIDRDTFDDWLSQAQRIKRL